MFLIKDLIPKKLYFISSKYNCHSTVFINSNYVYYMIKTNITSYSEEKYTKVYFNKNNYFIKLNTYNFFENQTIYEFLFNGAKYCEFGHALSGNYNFFEPIK